MSAACHEENCTVGETGVCLLENDPKSCPKRVSAAPSGEEGQGISELVQPLPQPPKNPQFPRSRTLTPDQARTMMSGRYCALIGILGDPDAGKTAALVSLYLLLSRSKLSGFEFADSRSIMAFNEISQGALDWNDGHLPDQLTVHTELVDDRTAGFLHLRVNKEGLDRPIDLLLPDLPGEWSQALVDSKRTDRLEFLKRADVIWLMMDGTQLVQPATRQWALHRMRVLMQRVAELVVPPPPVVLVLTRLDQGAVPPELLVPLHDEARLRGLSLSVSQIASFADEGPVLPGAGIADLVAAIPGPARETTACWPRSPTRADGDRAMLRYRQPEPSQ